MKKNPVSYDSEVGDRFLLQKVDEQLIFSRIPSGLYLYDVVDWYILMVANTAGKRKGYTIRNFAVATESW